MKRPLSHPTVVAIKKVLARNGRNVRHHHGNRKLTTEQVREIKRLLRGRANSRSGDEWPTQVEIARQFNVSLSTISFISARRIHRNEGEDDPQWGSDE